MAENKKTVLKKFKLSKENATLLFNTICDTFGFNISTEAKEQIITMNVNNVEMKLSQDLVDADAFIMRIMEGKIEFDEENEEIVYKLKKPIKTGEGGQVHTSEFRFGQFTRGKQLQTGVPLNKMSFSTMPDEDQTKVLQAMTGVSDDSIFMEVTTLQFNDMRMIAGYFFS
ncbi:hypothetical protein KAR91_02170 [Candidatus Pacearchaeota archaeon]|nr:hypothetical protein [Candidatus Pacearchaeota archaeon]